MNIVKGKQNAPVKAVVYGPEGIGKSTFASQWPAPLFLDCEGGTMRLAVDRVSPLSFSAVEQAVAELTANANGYKTLVIDTADWLEKQMIDHVCAAANQKSIEGFGYGKGYTHLAEAWRAFLDKVSRLQSATGMHVLFLAHAAMRKQELPDEQGAFDRWELKLLKQSPGVLKEWADLVLLLNYKTLVVEQDGGGRHKAQGGRRVMYATHHVCWDAKNRFGLPDEMPLEFAKIAGIFGDLPAAPSPAPMTTQAKPAAPAVCKACAGTGVNSKGSPCVCAATKAPAPAPAAVKENPTSRAPSAQPASSAAGATAGDNALAAVTSGSGAAAVKAVINELDAEKNTVLVQLSELMKNGGITKEELGAELARKGVVPADMNPREYNLATLKRVVSGWAAITHNINIRKGAATTTTEQKAA